MAYNSKYSTYKKYTASTEVSYASHTANTSYQREQSSEYTSNKGVLSSTKEIVSGSETRSLPVYIAIQDFTPEENDKDSMPLEQGQIVEVLDSKNPSSWLVRTKTSKATATEARPPRTGWVPGSYFESPTEYYKQRRRTREIEEGDLTMTPQQEALRKRDCVFEELLKKEEEFVEELRHLIETYIKVFDDPSTPDAVRHYRDQLTLNLREIYNFHANVLLKGLHYYSDDPGKVGQTFVRLERDFDYHVKYCRDEPDAEKILGEEKVKEYFDSIKEKIEIGEKTLIDYLKLPILRIQQYQTNLKEFIKYTTRAELNTKSLQKSLELMLSLPQRASDLNFVRNINGYPGDTVKLGRLLRHESFYVWDGDSPIGDARTLYLFLFKSRIVLTERQEPEDPDDLPEFKHIATIRLDKYEIEDVPEDNIIIIRAQEGEDLPTFCVKPVETAEPTVAKQAWVRDIVETKQGLVVEDEDATETMTEFVDMSDVRSEFSEYSTASRKSSLLAGPDEGPPRKKPKSPPAISPSGSAASLYSGSSGELTGTTLEMQGTRVTRTQYGFRTLQESSAKMCLKVTGYPLPIITWFKDGVQLEEDDRHTFYADDEGFFAMTIDPVKVEDTGRYTCVATNEYGQATTSAFFRVIKVEHEPASPKFQCQLDDKEISEGESVRFQCELEGWPEPEIVWLVDGQVVHPTPDFHIEYDGQKAVLEIKDAQPEDAGTYSVRITNEMGTKESSARLTVQEDPEKSKVPPEFQLTLEDMECEEGDTIRFKAIITGDPLPDINWLINGQGLTPSSNIEMLAEDGIYMITIKKISTHFDGEMMCRAVNRLGEAGSTARLTVKSKLTAPTFDHELSDQKVSVGDVVKMEVAVSGNPEPDVQWFIDGKQLISGSEEVTLMSKGDGVHRLEISKTKLSHSGNVTCKAYNEQGEAESSAGLQVVSEDKEETFEEEEIKENVQGEIEVQVLEEAQSEAQEEAEEELEEEVAYEEEMEVEEVSAEEEETSNKSASFIESIAAVSAEEGKEATFSAVITGDPIPQVTWFLNGKELKLSKNIKIESEGSSHRLTLLNLSQSQSGTVECRAENKSGLASCEASLDVSPIPVKTVAPKMKQTLKGKVASEGEKVVFNITIEGTPAPIVTWSINGKPIESGKEAEGFKLSDDGNGTYALQIESVSQKMSGVISVAVENSAGLIQSEAELKVKERTEAPEFKTPLEPQIVQEGDNIEMKVVASGLPAPSVKWSLDGKEIKHGVDKIKLESRKNCEFVLMIEDISASKCGLVTCRIENAAGVAESNATLAIKKSAKVTEGERVVESVSEQISEQTTVVETKGKVSKTSGATATSVPPPEIQSELKDYLLKEGENLKLELETSGEVEQVTWQLNENPLQKSESITISENAEQGLYQLEVKEITKDLAGLYSATVENEGGSVTTEAQVGVTAKRHSQKPILQSALSAINLNEGDVLKTKVLVSGDDVIVKWYINERIVVQTEDVVMTKENGVFTLAIDGASTDMSGKLKCVAYNRSGEVETTAPITVICPIPVEFEQFLADATCREGDTLKLKAVLLGEPSPEVTWYINGNKLVDTSKVTIQAEKSTYTVVIRDITCDYTGEVLCKAVNEYGEASSSAMLTVLPRGDPPDFTEWLSNVSVKEGGVVHHKVIFTGDPTPKLTWYINGEEMPKDKNVTIKQDGNSCVLTIEKFSGEYVGEVICKAENDAGEVSCTAHMTLITEAQMSEHSELEALAEDMDLDDGATDTALSIPDDELPEDEYTRTSTPVMAPKFITKMRDTKVKKGSQAIFECVVPDTKGVVVKWLKDGKEIELITRIRVMSKPGDGHTQKMELIIDKVQVSDMGDYSCVLSNTVGQEICTAQLVVEGAVDTEETQDTEPIFLSVLESVTVTEGEQIKLECKVSGQPKPEVKWFCEGKEISKSSTIELKSKKDGTQILIIEKSKVADSGSYKCLATSTAGASETTAEVSVQGRAIPPVFKQKLHEAAIEEGAKVELTCLVEGQPTPTIDWKKDGIVVNQDSLHEITATEEGFQTLILYSAAIKDAGLYQCAAQNVAGKVTTEAKLEIKKATQMEVLVEEAVAFSAELEPCTVTEGEDALYECAITGKATVQWLKDGKPLKADGKHVIIESKPDGSQTLQLINCSPKDVATYICQAETPTGKVSTQAALVVNMAEESEQEAMLIAPDFITPLQECTVTEGESTDLECSLADASQVKVEWLKDDEPVAADGKHVLIESKDDGKQKLSIIEARTEDTGEYSCKAYNEAGESKTAACLNVQHAEEEIMETEDAPTFTTELKACNVEAHDTAKFECALAGKAVVQWLKDGSPVQADGEHIIIESRPDGSQILMINDALEEDIGSYSCQATNDYGSISSEASLNVQIAEEVEEEVAAEEVLEFSSPLHGCVINEGEEADLVCSVQGNVEIKWMKDDKPVKADGKHILVEAEEDGTQSLTIQNARTEDTGVYSCQASLGDQVVKTEASLDVKRADQQTLSPGEVAPEFVNFLQPVNIEEGETATLECAVTGSPKPEVQWLCDGKEIKVDGSHILVKESPDGKVTLTIQNATSADAGQYTCKATNAAGETETKAKVDVMNAEQITVSPEEIAPRFSIPLEPVSIQEGESTTLECAITGSPKPELQWLCDGKPVKADGSHIIVKESADGKTSLSIKDTTTADAGQYTCKATNVVGDAETKARLDVKHAEQITVAPEEIAPGFSIPLEPVSIHEGESTTLECVITGSPKPEVQWLCDGKPVKADGSHIIVKESADGKTSLSIKDTTTADAGQYTCKATNVVGDAETKARLDVKHAEQIKVAPEEIAPGFSIPLEPVSIHEGESTTLECVITGSPKPEVQWLCDGKPVKADGSHILVKESADGKTSLSIKDTTTADAGQYTCKATNVVGDAETKARLDVKHAEQIKVAPEEIAPGFSIPLEPVSIHEGESTTLECVINGSPKPEVQWLCDGKPVKADGSHILVKESADGKTSLSIKDTTTADAGQYTCKATNIVGDAETKARLDVKHAEHVPVAPEDIAPEFSVPLQPVDVEEGEVVTLECAVTGSPKPEVQWLRDEEVVKVDGSHFVMKDFLDGKISLTIQNATTADAGQYTCKAMNAAGDAETKAKLDVTHAEQVKLPPEEFAPEISEPLQPVDIKEGEVATLECAVTGSPKPDVQWLCDGKAVKVDGSHILVKETTDGKSCLTIKDTKRANAGQYTCKATNPIGEAETTAKLDVKKGEIVEQEMEPETAMEIDTAPNFTKQLQGSTVEEGDNAVLECAVTGSPLPEVVWLKDGVAVEPDGKHIQIESKEDGTQRLVVKVAHAEDVGEYRCEASSAGGVAWSDALINVKKAVERTQTDEGNTAPEFTQVLHSCNAIESEQAELECKVKGTPMPTVQWLKDGEPIDDSIATAVSLPDGTHKLIFSQASMADAGEYRCEAKNVAGAAWTEAPLLIKTAEEMALDQGEIAPDFIEPLHSVTAEEGEPTVLECRVSGVPAPDVKWFREGEEITSDTPRVKIESAECGTVQRLMLDDTVVNDTGEYRCELSNPSGTTWSDATLNVHIVTEKEVSHEEIMAPEFITKLGTCTARPGETIQLKCVATASPSEVQWMKNNEELNNYSPHVKIESDSNGLQCLTIEHVGVIRGDIYTCKAINSAGAAITKAIIEFEEQSLAPETEPFSDDMAVEEQVMGTDTPQIGHDASKEDTFASIEDISLEKEDHFDQDTDENISECTIGHPWEAEQVEIMEEVAPEFLEELKACKAEQGAAIDLTCRVVGHPMPEVHWYKDGEEVIPDDTHKIASKPDGEQTLTITDAQEEDQGNYRVEATNLAGSMSCKAPVEVHAEEMEVEVSEAVAPEFSKKLEALFADAGTVAILECAVVGDSPNVQWYKDGKELTPSGHVKIESLPDGTQRLTIDKAGEDDIGKYTCEVANESGAVTTEAPVAVSVTKPKKPAFSRGLKDVTIKMGKTVEMSCVLDVNSVKDHPFAVKWYKNGKELEVSKKVTLNKTTAEDGVCALTIADSAIEDSAKYSCQVTNSAGMAETEAGLTVEKGEASPEFRQMLSDIQVVEGEMIILKCAATGEPFPEVKWTKNGKPLRIGGRVSSTVAADGSIELKIKDSCLEDGAKFTCLLKNSAGSSESAATVSVQNKPKSEAPKFIRELFDISAEEKTEVTLEVEVNTPKVTIKWLKDGNDISVGGIDLERASDTVFRLVINKMKFDHSGEYTCTARNENGAISTKAIVTLARPEAVEVEQLKFKKVLSDKKVKHGSKIILEVEVEGKPNTVKWHKPATAQKGEDKIKMEKDKERGLYRFILDGATVEDAGEYSVEAIGDNETIKSQCVIKVDVPPQTPEIVSPLEDVEAGAGDDVVLAVKTKGKPKVVKWYRNGKEIAPSKNAKPFVVGDDEFQLKLHDVGEDAAGDYKVVLENDAGTAESSAKLTIKEQAPSIKQPLTDREITEGGTVVLEVIAQGTIESVKWLKDGKGIKPDGKRIIAEQLEDGTCRLTIKDSKNEDTGVFTVKLSNSAGSVESEARLTVTASEPVDEQPVIVKGLEDTIVDEGDKLVLSIQVTGKPKQVKWYRNGQELKENNKRKLEKVDDQTYRLVVGECNKEDAGKYNVEVSNEVGSDESHAAVTVNITAPEQETTPEDEQPEILKGLEPVVAALGEDVVFSVKTKGKPKHIKWYRNGQELIASKKIKPSIIGENEFQLCLKDILKDAAGDYKVVVENDAGSADSEAKLTIKKAAPIIKDPLCDREVTLDGTVVLEIVAQGEIDTIKWYKDGDEIKPSKRVVYEYLNDGTCRLTIKDVKKSDAGKYTVELANSAGSASSDGKLTVNEPQAALTEEAPVIVKGLKDVTVDEGDKLTLQIEVKGKPKEIKWYRNGQEIKPNKNRRIEKVDDKTYRLIVPETSKDEDEGEYKVEATNDTGTADTEANVTIKLPIEAEKPEVQEDVSVRIVLPLRDQTVPEEDNINLKCQVAGIPFPEIAWLKDGKELEASDRIFLSVSGDGVCNLRITAAKATDAGKYKCIAKNERQEASTQCAVTVGTEVQEADQSAPKFVVPLSAAAGTEGKMVSFDIKVRGKPAPVLRWMKDGIPLEEDDRLLVEDMGDGRWRLTIKDANMSDAGKYSCEAKNSLGSDTTEASLRINPGRDKRKPGDERFAPIFNVPLRDRRIPEHANMSVECFVDARPKPEIQWTRDGEPLELSDRVNTTHYAADGKCRLEITDFSSADQGVYKCIAKNELGSANTKANLSAEVIKVEVQEEKRHFAPRFVSNLGDRRIKEGTSVSLDCKVLASPVADITWFKDGIPVKSNSRVKIEELDDGTQILKIENATEADDGAYRCVATNAVGTSNTSCMLGVDAVKQEKEKKGDAPTFSKGLTDVWVDKNKEIKLVCCVHGTPKPEIKWYKDGKLLRDSARIKIVAEDDGTCHLSVKECTFSDEGMYRCEAINTLGSARTAATVHVEAVRETKKRTEIEEGEAPRFVIPLEDHTYVLGASVEMEVKVTGKPVPQIKWSFNGLPLMQDSRVVAEKISDTNYRLTIKRTTIHDDGTYRITASNESGTVHSKAFIAIDEGVIGVPTSTEPTAQPKFVVPFGDVRANEGTPVKLECRLSGNPNPDITWFKDGEKISPSDRIKTEVFPDGTARLYIADATPDDEGLYRCVASNPFGTDNIKAYVTVKASPLTVRGFSPMEGGKEPKLIIPLESVPTLEGGSVTLSCKFTGDPDPTLKWMKDGERIYPFGRCSLSKRNDGTADFTISNLITDDAGCYRCIAENDWGVARTMCEVTVQAKERKSVMSLDDTLRMGKAPGFTKPLTVRRVKEGQATSFECVTYGNPTPAIKWLKDGVEVCESDRIKIQTDSSGLQKLIVDEVLHSDDGFYRCVASNEYGTCSTKAEMIVEPDPEKKASKAKAFEEEEEESKPKIRRGLQNLTITKGSPAEFEVAVGGKPIPTVKWYRNGQELTPSDRILMWKDDWGFHRLVVLGAEPEDEATYSCEAINKLGSAKTQGDLTILKERETKGFVGPDGIEMRDAHDHVPGPPGFLKQVKNKHSFTGMPVVFDCITIGSPQPEVEWLHNGKKVVSNSRIKVQSSGGGSHALVILRASPEDSGEYVAVAKNSSGTAKSSGVLDVTVPYLDNIRFGEKYDLNAMLAGEYVYKKTPYAGIPTPPDRGPFIAEVTGHYLTLSWIPTKRAPPRYPQVSYVIEMRELPDPQWILLDYNIPEPVCKVRNLERGQSYQFRVRAENIYGISDPSPASPPSQLMAPPQPVLDKNKRPIHIRDPYMLDAMDKAYGEQFACAPWFAPRAGDKVYCAETDSIELNFFVHGFPDPKVQWRFRGYELDTQSPTSRFSVTTLGGSQCILNIRGFNKADAGQYQCYASNQYGDAQQNVFIELAERPNFIQPLSDKMVSNGKTVRFDCRVDGNPYPEIRWFKDWYPLVESSRVRISYEPPYLCSLIITDAILRDTGIYSCVATNEASKASTTATLTVEADLGIIEEVEIPRKKVNLTPRKIREIYSVEEEVMK